MKRSVIVLSIIFIILFVCLGIGLEVKKKSLTTEVVMEQQKNQEEKALEVDGQDKIEEDELNQTESFVEDSAQNQLTKEDEVESLVDKSSEMNLDTLQNSGKELSQDELDKLHAIERKQAAKPYESQILPEFLDTYEQNNQLIGWIRLEGTDIDCPVLQSIENYDFYLTHDIEKQESEQGCIILDPDSEIGIGTKEEGYLEGYMPSTNQLVHGHNMKSGTMFGALDYYAKESYANKHPYIYFDSLYEHRVYELALAFYSKVYPEEEDVFKYYNFNQADTKEAFADWLIHIQALALYERPMDITYGDEMITLSTCAYQEENGRFAVVGKRIQ